MFPDRNSAYMGSVAKVYSKPKPPAAHRQITGKTSGARVPAKSKFTASEDKDCSSLAAEQEVENSVENSCHSSESEDITLETALSSSGVSSAVASNDSIDSLFCDQNDCNTSKTQDSGVVTDVCSVDDPDEVEILSLVQEQLPRYRLRADTTCEFGGYSHQDWIQTPVIDLDAELPLTDEQMSETLKYFILCAERVSQMTRTYNDPEAVTHLLQQRENDLELAARIGQTLLAKNKELKGRLEEAKEQLSAATEQILQLKHELSKKESLLQLYNEDLLYHAPADSSASANGYNQISMEMLQRKVGTLEEENFSLRQESAQLYSDTENFEEKEKKLMEDFVQQLADASHSAETTVKELHQKMEENFLLEEKVNTLLGQLQEVQEKARQLSIENKDFEERLEASDASQHHMRRELNIQKDKYDELFEMLKEAQDEVRTYRNRHTPRASNHLYDRSPSPGLDSLASELQSSMCQELTSEEGKKTDGHRWKVFETAKAANRAASRSGRGSSLSMSMSNWTDPESQASSVPNSDTESFVSDTADFENLCGSFGRLGRPGIPGSNDLHTALRRLESKDGNVDNSPLNSARRTRSENVSPFKLPGTPDSLSSTPSGYSYLSSSNSLLSPSQFKIPSKLRIVKPMEGSVTLQHWQRLAQPHLGGLFEFRDGVKVKGERKLDLEGDVFTLSDFEEDEDFMEYTRGCMTDRAAPNLNHSLVNSKSYDSSLSSASVQPLASSTPEFACKSSDKQKGRKTKSSSYAMSLGLAAILHDRDTGSTRHAAMKPSSSYPVIPAEAVATVSAGQSSASPRQSEDKPISSVNNPSLLGKLINSGYSLLWNKPVAPVSSAPEFASSAEGQGASVDKAQPAKKPTAKQILPEGKSGVLSAITTLRKSGIL